MINDDVLFDRTRRAVRKRFEELDGRPALEGDERAEYAGLMELLLVPPAAASGSFSVSERLNFLLHYHEPLWQEGIRIPAIDRIAREDRRCLLRERLAETASSWAGRGVLLHGISIACAEQLLGGLILAGILRSFDPGAPIVLGGSVFSLLPPAILEQVARLPYVDFLVRQEGDRKSTRLNSSHIQKSRMPSSA